MPSSVDTPMLWREVAEDGNALQFLGPPQTPDEVARHVLAAVGTRRAEVFPNRADGLLARAAMLAPGVLRRRCSPRWSPWGVAGGSGTGGARRRGICPVVSPT